jgi:hypothetical protein
MAAQRDLEIPARSTVEFVVDVLGGPASLVGYTGAMQIRELRTDADPIAELSPSNFTVNAVTRQVTVRIPGADTAAYDFRRGVYDVYITGPGGDSWRLVEGRVTVSQSVTRED